MLSSDFSHIYRGFKVLCCTIQLVLVLRKPWSFLVFVTIIGEAILTQKGPQLVSFSFGMNNYLVG
jgi:hypothetical protein